MYIHLTFIFPRSNAKINTRQSFIFPLTSRSNFDLGRRFGSVNAIKPCSNAVILLLLFISLFNVPPFVLLGYMYEVGPCFLCITQCPF